MLIRHQTTTSESEVINKMEQIAIITKLVQEMKEMGCPKEDYDHFILNLDCAVRTLTYIKEDTPKKMAWALKREEERPAREVKEAKEQEEKRLVKERQEAYKKEAQRERRRHLYQVKKMEKAEREKKQVVL